MCKEAQKQARMYQESIRDIAELEDTTGVELFQGRDSGKARSMMAIKAEKIQRAKYCTSSDAMHDLHCLAAQMMFLMFFAS